MLVTLPFSVHLPLPSSITFALASRARNWFFTYPSHLRLSNSLLSSGLTPPTSGSCCFFWAYRFSFLVSYLFFLLVFVSCAGLHWLLSAFVHTLQWPVISSHWMLSVSANTHARSWRALHSDWVSRTCRLRDGAASTPQPKLIGSRAPQSQTVGCWQ